MLTLKARRAEGGFTLIEVLMAMLLLSLLTVLTISTVTNNLNESRYATTLRRMRILRKGFVGETQWRGGSIRSSFGFNGDIGAIPTASQGVAALITNPGLPAYATNATPRIGFGWNQGYLDSGNATENFTVDAWGQAWAYAPTASPPTLTSYAADGASGGTGYNKDIVMQLPSSATTAIVHGVIVQNGGQWTGTATVELNYANGTGSYSTMTTSVAATDYGHFVFSNVPQGVRSATVYIPSKAAATKTIGPVAFSVDRPYYLINVRYFDVGSTVGPTSLEVPIEMLDYGVSSAIININTIFTRSLTPLTTTDYDGTVTYLFEVVGTNTGILGEAVNIVNSANATVGSVTIPGGTTSPTRVRGAFTPTVGSDQYRVQLPLTLILNAGTITEARIIVQQVGATKTKVYVPLLSSLSTSYSNTDTAVVDTTSSTAPTQATPLYYSVWHKDLSKLSLATGTPYTFMAILNSSSALATATASLFNRTTGLAVGGASLSVSGTTPTYTSVALADSANNFSDQSDYEVRLASNSGLFSASIAKAGLWITLTNLGSGEAYYRVARASSGTGTQTINAQRALLTTTNFSNPTVLSEAVGFTATVGTPAYVLLDASTNDTGTASSTVSGSSLTFTAAKSRLRSASLTTPSGDRFLGGVVNSGSSATSFSSGLVVVQFHN